MGAVAAGALVSACLCTCEAGSRSVTPELYSLNIDTWTQTAQGVAVTGSTDLPDGSRIDLMVSSAHSADEGLDNAVLVGSSEDVPHAIRDHRFTIAADRVLPNSCGARLPCGPFPAGAYLMVLDAKTPPVLGVGNDTLADPRYLDTTHGVAGFSGLEISQIIILTRITKCIDSHGIPGFCSA